MASLATHFSAFLFFFPLGTRRLLCSSSLYLKNPHLYRSKAWYFSEPRWKNLDFYTLLVALPIVSFSLAFLFLAFPPGQNPTYRFSFLHQSAVVFLYWVLALLILFHENWDPITIPDSFVFVFAGTIFLIEHSLNGIGFTGLGGNVYELLGWLTIICAASCFYLAIRPTAFFAEFVLSFAIVMKGSWALQSGLNLYTDLFSLKGCDKISISRVKGLTDVKCPLEEDSLRGVALMNLLFIGHTIGILVGSFVVFGLLCRNRGTRCGGEATGPLLAQLESDTTLVRNLTEFEIE